jgi:phage terminase large subunit-like protein
MATANLKGATVAAWTWLIAQAFIVPGFVLALKTFSAAFGSTQLEQQRLGSGAITPTDGACFVCESDDRTVEIAPQLRLDHLVLLVRYQMSIGTERVETSVPETRTDSRPGRFDRI